MRFNLPDSRLLAALMLSVLTGVCASVLIVWMTAQGPGVSPDSVTYLETARNLMAGNGFYWGGKPMTAHPPGYPLLLAIAGFPLQGNVLHAARWLGMLLFAVNLALLGLSLFAVTKRSLAAMGCGLLVFLASAPIVRLHAMAWSEAPFIAFLLAGFLLLSIHLARPRTGLLLAAALCAGCAIATRYIGFTILPAMAGALLFFGDRPLSRKLGETVLLSVVAALPLAAWMIRNHLIAGTATSRTFVLHPMGPDQAWLLGSGIALALVAGALLFRKNGLRQEASPFSVTLPALCLAFVLTYLLGLGASLSFFDADTPLDGRILAPAFVTLLIPGLALAWTDSPAWSGRLVRGGILLVVLLAVALNVLHARPEVMRFHRNASGYTARKWTHSATLAAVSALPADVTLYSNGPDAVLFLTGRSAMMIPPKYFPITHKPNPDYESQQRALAREAEEGRAVVVYLKHIKRNFFASQQELESEWALPVIARLADGALYGRVPPPTNPVSETR